MIGVKSNKELNLANPVIIIIVCISACRNAIYTSYNNVFILNRHIQILRTPFRTAGHPSSGSQLLASKMVSLLICVSIIIVIYIDSCFSGCLFFVIFNQFIRRCICARNSNRLVSSRTLPHSLNSAALQ